MVRGQMMGVVKREMRWVWLMMVNNNIEQFFFGLD